LFIVIAYIGTPSFVPIMILFHWLAKVLIETAATPFTYMIVNFLKKRESIDTFDYQTRFNPFIVTD
jgi:hypothetical protein